MYWVDTLQQLSLGTLGWFLNLSLPGCWHVDTAAPEARVLFAVLARALSQVAETTLLT